MMKNKKTISIALSLFVFVLAHSCSSIPHGATPVANFDAQRYLGTWYEIARFDYRFERNLDNVLAQYCMQDDGDIGVLNSGYNTKKEEWKSAKGSAKFRINENTGALKVTFFKPFYSGYNVIAIDKDYRYALVAGRSLKYLWILSKEKSMPEEIKQAYLVLAENIGYDTSKLIWVKHDKKSPFLDEK